MPQIYTSTAVTEISSKMHMHQSCLGFFLWTIPCILQQMPIEFLCLCVSFSLFPHFNLFAEEKDKRNPAVYEVIEKLKESLWKLKYQHFLSCNWEKKLQCFTSPDQCLHELWYSRRISDYSVSFVFKNCHASETLWRLK